MLKGDKTALILSLYQIGAIQFGEFILKSGQTSSIYLNLRKIISYPKVLRALSSAIWEKTKTSGCQFDVVCGVPYTALPVAVCLSLMHEVPMVLCRKEKKEHGTKQRIEGVFQPGERCLLIEDVITTGGSLIETGAELEKAGLVIKDVAVLIDREQGGREALSKKYQVHTILQLSELLEGLLSSSEVTATDRQLIQTWLAERASNA